MLVQIFFSQYIGFGLLFGEFLLTAFLLFLLSMKLTKLADRLEKMSGLSDVWIGMLLLAFITSLPEAVNAIGSTFIEGAVNLGIGNLAGSNMFNIFIIVVLDLVHGPAPILMLVKNHQVSIAAGGILLMTITGIVIALHIPFKGFVPPGNYIGIIFSIVIFVAFLFISWFLSRHEEQEPSKVEEGISEKDAHAGKELHHSVLLFVITSVFVIATSIWLLRTCDALARQPVNIGERSFLLSHTLVGAVFVALVTSLPELFVSLGALKLGQVNMSIANIFGSNIMNMGFIPLMHLFAGNAAFYSSVSPLSLVMLFAAILMSALFINGVLIHSKKTICYLGWTTFLILITYGFSTYLLFCSGVS